MAQAAPDGGQDLTPTARDLSDQALRQYQQGDFDAAIESFTGAYALSNNPGLLFNVAQAYRLKGDCERARDYYQRYVSAVPETALKPSLERRVAEMEACLKKGGAKSTIAATEAPRPGDAAAVVATTARPTPRDVAPPPEASTKKRAAVWALRGSGVALLASSAVFGALSWDAHRDFDNAPTMRAGMEANDRYKTDTTLTWTFAATGLACVVISYFVGRAR
jgi:tetratricopeptide (TPR) repeat protein